MVNQDPPGILVVDDEIHLADLFTTWLSSDYAVETAYGGEKALELFDDTVDVVLLDRRMPGLSGDEVLTRIRESGVDCRIAMVTAVEPDIDIFELGFDAYLTKPVTSEELHEVVETLLFRKQHDTTSQKYFQLASKRAVLKSNLGSEVTSHPEYHELEAEMESLEEELDGLATDFEDEDFKAQFYRLDQDLDGERERSTEERVQ